ncbi:MAG: SEC-C domain-containing protein [Thermoflexales bacterium]|nr:SEC-C domain-containing protein [Thermoflexales bacterium]
MMLEAIRSQVARDIYRVQPAQSAAAPAPRRLSASGASSSGSGKGRTPVRNVPSDIIGRNDPCPCGSGKKYKQCHGAPDAGPLPGRQSGAAAPATPTKQRK